MQGPRGGGAPRPIAGGGAAHQGAVLLRVLRCRVLFLCGRCAFLGAGHVAPAPVAAPAACSRIPPGCRPPRRPVRPPLLQTLSEKRRKRLQTLASTRGDTRASAALAPPLLWTCCGSASWAPSSSSHQTCTAAAAVRARGRGAGAAAAGCSEHWVPTPACMARAVCQRNRPRRSCNARWNHCNATLVPPQTGARRCRR